jgi:hypothetical protein
MDREVVRAAIEALGTRLFYDNMGVVNILISYLRSPDASLRRSAIAALGRVGNPIATGDLAKMLRDPETQVRFETIVAMGNIGVPMALTYLEMMDPDDPLNDALVMNARRETIYSIKKKNKMYPASHRCPFCGGYDIISKSAPYKCHDCSRPFGKAEEPPAAGQSQRPSAAETWSQPEASHDCPICHRDLPLLKCEYCGKSYCRNHIHPRAHRCWYTDYKPVEDRVLSGGWGIFSSKAVRNLAILAVLLLLMMSIGVFLVINHSNQPDAGTYTPTRSPTPTLRQSFTAEDYIGTWYYHWQTGPGASDYDDRYLDVYRDKSLTVRQVLNGTTTIMHGKWSDVGANSLSFSYNDGIASGRPLSMQLLSSFPDNYQAMVTSSYGNDGMQRQGLSYHRLSSTPA